MALVTCTTGHVHHVITYISVHAYVGVMGVIRHFGLVMWNVGVAENTPKPQQALNCTAA